MSGTYGTIRPANIDVSKDVEMFYYYRPTRGSESQDFNGYKPLDSSFLVGGTKDSDGTGILGVYNLRLPVDKFNRKGFYSVYIRPKEVICNILDVSVLAAYPDVKGIVFNLSDLNGLGISDTDLTGYRIDYFDNSGNRTDTTRLITSCNYCEPVLVTITDTYPKSTRYKYTDSSSNMVFCTVTPSSSLSFRPNIVPYIGYAGCKIALSNTKFNPVLLDLEMVEHDIETITNMVEGDQVRNRDKGIITVFNGDKEIYKQQEYYTVKDKLGNALYDVKKGKDSIDSGESYDKTIDNV